MLNTHAQTLGSWLGLWFEVVGARLGADRAEILTFAKELLAHHIELRLNHPQAILQCVRLL